MITLKALSKNWIFQAFRESWNQKGIRRKLKHLKYRLLWDLRPMFKIAGNYPLAVDIEAHSRCNFRCVFCQQTDEKYWGTQEQQEMSWDTFKIIVDQCADIGVFSMKVNWRGEPLLNERIADMIFYMKQMGIHEVMMNTNGSKLTPELADKLLSSGLDRIIFSCDGVSKETYNKIRKGGDWHDFYSKVNMFSEKRQRRKARGFDVPIIRINIAVMEENHHEVPKFKEVFEGIADELRFNTLYNPQQSNKFLKSRRRKVKRKGCPQIYQRMIISAEGDATVCCADYQKKLKSGNVNEIGIRDMYLTKQERIRDIHESHNARKLDGCKSCDLFALSSKDDAGKILWS